MQFWELKQPLTGHSSTYYSRATEHSLWEASSFRKFRKRKLQQEVTGSKSSLCGNLRYCRKKNDFQRRDSYFKIGLQCGKAAIPPERTVVEINSCMGALSHPFPCHFYRHSMTLIWPLHTLYLTCLHQNQNLQEIPLFAVKT